MIKGMTGFGRASLQSGAGRISVEIKSINHRYFEFVAHMPTQFNIFEERIRKEIQSLVKRGRIVYVLNFSHSALPSVYLNKKLAQHYLNQLKRLAKDLRLKDNITLQQILNLEGVVAVVESEQPSEAVWSLIQSATRASLQQLVRMRNAEGKSIYNDILKKLSQADSLAKSISDRSRIVFAAKKKQLAREDFSAFTKDHDINEEITRLSYHIKSLKQQLHKAAAAGKEIDFISQELQRETNTIGAKMPDEKISHYVVKLKGIIEQIREQSQNTE